MVTEAVKDQKIKVRIADQQPLFRKGIRYSLSQVADIDICGEVSSGSELMSAIGNLCPEVVLLDIDLLLKGGLELAPAVKQQLLSMGIIILTPQTNDDELFEAIKSWAAAYLNRYVSSDGLVATIRRAAAGEYPVNDTFLA